MQTTDYPYRQVGYFPGLDGLRAVAAALVLVHHAEDIRRKYHLPHLDDWSITNLGGLAVSFFFVLSGFLITFLLLRESAANQAQLPNAPLINLRRFYARRILRIWPLYFLTLLLGALLVPVLVTRWYYPLSLPFQLNAVWVYYLLFLPFLVNYWYGHHLLEPLWSIGVEEYFYLAWGPLFRFLRRFQQLPYWFLGLVLFKTVLLQAGITLKLPPAQLLLLRQLQFEAMAIGGLGAYWLFFQVQPIGRLTLFRPVGLALGALCLGVRLGAHQYWMAHPVWGKVYQEFTVISPWGDLLVLGLFLWLILAVATLTPRHRALDGWWWRRMGKISYGIYLLHLLVLVFVFAELRPWLAKLDLWTGTALFYLVSGLAVGGVAYFAKRYFEDFFLRFKP